VKAQDWAEEYTRTMLGKLVKVKEARRYLSEPLRYGLVLEIDPMRYGGAMHAQQRPGAFVLWADGPRVWEPCVYLEPASE
jgi:hypothetical protein